MFFSRNQRLLAFQIHPTHVTFNHLALWPRRIYLLSLNMSGQRPRRLIYPCPLFHQQSGVSNTEKANRWSLFWCLHTDPRQLPCGSSSSPHGLMEQYWLRNHSEMMLTATAHLPPHHRMQSRHVRRPYSASTVAPRMVKTVSISILCCGIIYPVCCKAPITSSSITFLGMCLNV
jgi:hypothetical protein